MNEEELRKLRDNFAKHIGNLFDKVIAREEFPELLGMYVAGDLVFQVHNGMMILARRTISGPGDTVPDGWLEK